MTGLEGKEEGISLAPHYHFYLLYRHLDISQTITAESLPLHIASIRIEPGILYCRAQIANYQAARPILILATAVQKNQNPQKALSNHQFQNMNLKGHYSFQ